MSFSLLKLDTLHPMPGVSLWKKDVNSVLIDVNQEYARLFGFKRAEDAIGKLDSDVPCPAAKLADLIQQNDKEVINNKKSVKFLEILQVANHEWKILLIVKTPNYINNKALGTFAYCVEIPHLKYKQLDIHTKKLSLTQASYRIVDANPLLTQAETECLFLFIRGKTVNEIASLLTLSPKTVNKHLSLIKAKMGCDNDTQLIETSIEKNYLNIFPESFLNTHNINTLNTDLIQTNELQISKRQLDCLYHLTRGMTAKEIGIVLNISARTVEDHLNILKKRLKCSTRSSLISKALDIQAIKEKLILS